MTGSTRAAVKAGRNAAVKATSATTPLAAASIQGSVALTPYKQALDHMAAGEGQAPSNGNADGAL